MLLASCRPSPILPTYGHSLVKVAFHTATPEVFFITSWIILIMSRSVGSDLSSIKQQIPVLDKYFDQRKMVI